MENPNTIQINIDDNTIFKNNVNFDFPTQSIDVMTDDFLSLRGGKKQNKKTIKKYRKNKKTIKNIEKIRKYRKNKKISKK
jgi:hypothetical protein